MSFFGKLFSKNKNKDKKEAEKKEELVDKVEEQVEDKFAWKKGDEEDSSEQAEDKFAWKKDDDQTQQVEDKFAWKQEEVVEDVKAEVPVWEATKEEVVEDVKAEVPAWEATKEEVVEDVKAEVPAWEATKEEVVEDVKAEVPAWEATKEEVVEDVKAEVPAWEATKEEVVEDLKAEVPAWEATKEEVVEDVKAEAPAWEATKEEVVEEVKDEVPTLETPQENVVADVTPPVIPSWEKVQQEVEAELDEAVAKREAEVVEEPEETKEKIKEDLDKGLAKSNLSIMQRFSRAIAGKDVVDDDVLDEIEEVLVSSDISIDTVVKVIKRLQARVARDKYLKVAEVYEMVKQEIIDLLTENNTPDYTDFTIPETNGTPYVILVVGVNGAGKTTTIGKLAHRFKLMGKTVLLGAADTFRAAAVEQLVAWSERADVPIIKQKTGSDPAAVAYDTVEAGVARNADVIIVDTAGRLHTKVNLMRELGKIKKVVEKVHPDFPHEVLLIVDGSTGQNALIQAREFAKATEVSAIAVTKLDGTAKGGAVIGIADQFKFPIKYIGVGEGIEHLQVFNKRDYVESLFKKMEG